MSDILRALTVSPDQVLQPTPDPPLSPCCRKAVAVIAGGWGTKSHPAGGCQIRSRVLRFNELRENRYQRRVMATNLGAYEHDFFPRTDDLPQQHFILKTRPRFSRGGKTFASKTVAIASQFSVGVDT